MSLNDCGAASTLSLAFSLSSMSLSGCKLSLYGHLSPFLKFLRVRPNFNDFIKVYQTEEVKKNLNPKWNIFEVSYAKFGALDPNQKIRIECWDFNKSGKHIFM